MLGLVGPLVKQAPDDKFSSYLQSHEWRALRKRNHQTTTEIIFAKSRNLFSYANESLIIFEVSKLRSEIPFDRLQLIPLD